MATTTSKQHTLTQLLTVTKKRYEPAEPVSRPVLEQLLYAIVREGATRPAADQAFARLQTQFFDWNEVRVSHLGEVEEALAGLPDRTRKAERIIGVLQEVFEKTYNFDLEETEKIDKKGLKQAAKDLSRFREANDYAVAWVVQQSLGGHAIPVDAPTLRVLGRLGVIDDEQADIETLRASLEHLIPKAKGTQFVDLVAELASEFCHDDKPNCSQCPLRGDCPTGQGNPPPRREPGAPRLKPR